MDDKKDNKDTKNKEGEMKCPVCDKDMKSCICTGDKDKKCAECGEKMSECKCEKCPECGETFDKCKCLDNDDEDLEGIDDDEELA